jgi:hypothetical protein
MKNRKPVAITFKLLLCLGTFGLGVFNKCLADIVEAKSADDFVQRIQGMAHLHLEKTSYVINWDAMKDNLGSLGIRHLRRTYTPPMATQENIDRHHYLYDNYGIRFQFQVRHGFSEEGSWNQSQLQENLNVIKRDFTPEMIARLEGPNEAPFESEQQRQAIVNYQTELYKLTKDDPILSQFPVVCFSTINLSGLTLFDNLYKICDVGNVHSYPAGRMPADFVDNIQKRFNNTKAYPTKGLMGITEEAYGNRANNFPQSMHTNSNVQAKYEQRLLLLQFEKNMTVIGRSQLADAQPYSDTDSKWDHIGYLRYDGSPKPVYYAMKNLFSLLGESKWNKATKTWLYPPTFSPGALDYTLEGNTSNLKHILFQKSDKSFFLVLWQEEKSWNSDTGTAIQVPVSNITFKLKGLIENAKLWQPYNSSNPSSKMRSKRVVPCADDNLTSTINVSVPDYPIVIELKPKI